MVMERRLLCSVWVGGKETRTYEKERGTLQKKKNKNNTYATE
jgi:hypothetical protein